MFCTAGTEEVKKIFFVIAQLILHQILKLSSTSYDQWHWMCCQMSYLWCVTFSTGGACSHYPRQTIKEVAASVRLAVKRIATYTFRIALFVSHETRFLNSILT